MVRERSRDGLPGLPMLLLWVVAVVSTVVLFINGVGAADRGEPTAFVQLGGAMLLGVMELLMLGGFFMVAPNEAKVLQLFGDYVGTARRSGLHLVNPFYSKKKISLRVRNFESSHLKVNDSDGECTARKKRGGGTPPAPCHALRTPVPKPLPDPSGSAASGLQVRGTSRRCTHCRRPRAGIPI